MGEVKALIDELVRLTNNYEIIWGGDPYLLGAWCAFKGHRIVAYSFQDERPYFEINGN